jgi:hypothetical protein
MTDAETVATTSQAQFWRADRDTYLVDPALRDEATSHLRYPVPESKADRWVIIREVRDDQDPYELPSPRLVGEFKDRETAERICYLIARTAFPAIDITSRD